MNGGLRGMGSKTECEPKGEEFTASRFNGPFRIETESGAFYSFGELESDGWRRVDREYPGDGPLFFNYCFVVGSIVFKDQKDRQNGSFLKSKDPKVGFRLSLRINWERGINLPGKHMLERVYTTRWITTPVVKIEFL